MIKSKLKSYSGTLIRATKLGPLLDRLNLTEQCFAEEEARQGTAVQNVRILFPAQRLQIASPQEDSFVPVGKYYREGWFDRPNVFVCDVPEAKVHIPTGLVCTRDFKGIADFGLNHRMGVFGPFGKKKPLRVKKLRGTYSTINYCLAGNAWHWMLDCLPKIHSLAKVEPTARITLLMPAFSNEFQRETLRCVVPDHFQIDYVIGDEWVQAEKFLWASLVSDRCMGLLPEEYYQAIRNPIFRKLGLPADHRKTERIYISRRKARYRRVTNEDSVMLHLEKFGFRIVDLEELTFQQEVELFYQAEIVIGPHGAGLGSLFFAGRIPIVVLYPTRVPPNYFHTLAIGLGQKHHFVCHDELDEDSNFEVNLPALEHILKNELNLKPSA